MATWNQNINSGGFLSGIGQVNTNAPQASDVNATLGMIRQNNELARTGRDNVGLQALQGLQGLSDTYKQDQLKKTQAAFNQAHANAWKSGDTSALRDFAIQNPAFIGQAQQAVSGLDAGQRSDMTNQAAKLRLALSQGPDAYAQYLQKNSGELSRVGANPGILAQMGIQDPQGAAQLFDTLGMAGSGDKYFDILDKLQGRAIDVQKVAIDRDKAAETARSNRVGESQGWANVNIAQQNANIRKLELEDKKYDRQIANETNALKLADLQDKRQQNQQKIEQAQRDKSDSFHQANDTFNQTIDTANKVLNSPGFDNYFGVSMSKLPMVGTIPGTDAADTEALVNTLSSQGFLTSIQQMKGMGALSDAEGKKISSAIASLDSKQSDKSARESIKTIISVTKAAQNRLQNKYGNSVQPKMGDGQTQPTQTTQPVASAGFSSLWGD